MSLKPRNTKKFFTGVSLEPQIVKYVDNLAIRMGTNRSWVLNTIVYEYAKLIENKNIGPLSSKQAVIRL